MQNPELIKNFKKTSSSNADFLNNSNIELNYISENSSNITLLYDLEVEVDKKKFLEYVNYYIDSDPYKWEMEYLNNKIPIVSPLHAQDHPPSILIIASMYTKNILLIIIYRYYTNSSILPFSISFVYPSNKTRRNFIQQAK